MAGRITKNQHTHRHDSPQNTVMGLVTGA